MTTDDFFEHFLDELKQTPELSPYYKFLDNPERFEFRRAYFLQRLNYISREVFAATEPEQLRIWDCGCGYGTTDFYLAMNHVPVHGTTIEFYYDLLPKRFGYWQALGPADHFTVSYENLFDAPPAPASYDRIIVQDTLHHLEPLSDALKIFYESLAPGGRMILIEENGSNLIQRAKLFKQRGNRRIIQQWDEKLGKYVLFGNENIRSYDSWKRAFEEAGFRLHDREYIRYLWPKQCSGLSVEEIRRREQTVAEASPLRREYLFFGLNFVAEKPA